MRKHPIGWTLPGCCLALACGPFDDVDEVRTWARIASAPSIYSHVHQPFAVASGVSNFADPACPVTTQVDHYVLEISGGCTDSEEVSWVGRARASIGRVELDGFGSAPEGTAQAPLTGTVGFGVDRDDYNLHEFEAHFVQLGGVATTFHYEGTVAGSFEGPTLWNGTGRVERDGPVAPSGTVYATTVDELIDGSICAGQPLSGHTELESDGQTARIEYDGASDCDEAQRARLFVDGEDEGKIDGIGCGISPARSRGAGRESAVVLCLLGLLGLRAGRRERRAHPGDVRGRAGASPPPAR